MNIQTIKNVSDCVPLYLPHSLYVKPNAKINISVALSTPAPGKTISNWDVMDKLRQIIQPDLFSVLRVTKTTLDFIRFEAEIEDREKLKNVLARLDGRSIKLSSFSEPLKVRSTENKDDFPTRHDWDSFFRDAKNMDEMKPGERPDTIHISNLPIRWFCPRHLENDENVKPSENIFKRIFEKFGEVRCVDIPICDPYRSQMKSHVSGLKTFSFDQDLFFEGYIQFSEYISFVRAMDTFRGMKIVRKEGDKNFAVNINVTFDKTKHLSEMSIKRRKIFRDRILAKEKEKEDEERRKMKESEDKLEKERLRREELKQLEYAKQRAREEKRKEKQLKKLREKEQNEINSKIKNEEKKLLFAQRKLESIRLLEALFERIKLKSYHNKIDIKKENEKNRKKSKGITASSGKPEYMEDNDLRNKLAKKYKTVHEKEFKKHKERLKKTKEGKAILANILTEHSRSPSVNSISSNDSILNDRQSNDRKNKKKKRKNNDNSDDSSSSSGNSSTDEGDETVKANKQMQPMLMPPQGFPVQPIYNPETGEWMGMGMYPYPQFFQSGHMPQMRPNFFSNPALYRGKFRGIRGTNRFIRGRGRGQYRGRGNYNNSYENDDYYRYFKHKSGQYDEEEYEGEHDYRQSRSRSRSNSKSKSRSRSYSRSRSRRSKSRSKSRRRHRSRTRSRSHRRSKSSKLVSTLRRTNSHSSKSRSRSRSRSSSHWSSASSKRNARRKSRSWSQADSKSRSHSKSHKQHEIVLEPDKLMRTAKEIQRTVKKKLLEEQNQNDKESSTQKQPSSSSGSNKSKRVDKHHKSSKSSKKRSLSVDSDKFISPKRREISTTPEKRWK